MNKKNFLTSSNYSPLSIFLLGFIIVAGIIGMIVAGIFLSKKITPEQPTPTTKINDIVNCTPEQKDKDGNCRKS